GTFFQENNMLKSTASGLQGGGSAMVYGGTAITIVGGGVLGGPLATIGGVMGTDGAGLELAIDAVEGKLSIEKAATKTALYFIGAKMGTIGRNQSEKRINESAIKLLDSTLDDARDNKKGVYKE